MPPSPLNFDFSYDSDVFSQLIYVFKYFAIERVRFVLTCIALSVPSISSL